MAEHRHPDDIHQSRTLGERMADRVSARTGSWRFIWGYLALTVVWTGGNMLGVLRFDPWPFIGYTFAVSCLAILMSSIILLSGNRQADIDRAHAELAFRHVDELLTINHMQTDLLIGLEARGVEQHAAMLAKLDSLIKE